MTRFKVVAKMMLSKDIVKTDSKHPEVDVMVAASAVHPVIDARRVSTWFGMSQKKAEDVLEDLFCRGHFWRKRDGFGGWKYCESTRDLDMTEAQIDRQHSSRVACRKKRVSKR